MNAACLNLSDSQLAKASYMLHQRQPTNISESKIETFFKSYSVWTTLSNEWQRIHGVVNLADALDDLRELRLKFDHKVEELVWQLGDETSNKIQLLQ